MDIEFVQKDIIKDLINIPIRNEGYSTVDYNGS